MAASETGDDDQINLTLTFSEISRLRGRGARWSCGYPGVEVGDEDTGGGGGAGVEEEER